MLVSGRESRRAQRSKAANEVRKVETNQNLLMKL